MRGDFLADGFNAHLSFRVRFCHFAVSNDDRAFSKRAIGVVAYPESDWLMFVGFVAMGVFPAMAHEREKLSKFPRPLTGEIDAPSNGDADVADNFSHGPKDFRFILGYFGKSRLPPRLARAPQPDCLFCASRPSPSLASPI